MGIYDLPIVTSDLIPKGQVWVSRDGFVMQQATWARLREREAYMEEARAIGRRAVKELEDRLFPRPPWIPSYKPGAMNLEQARAFAEAYLSCAWAPRRSARGFTPTVTVLDETRDWD